MRSSCADAVHDKADLWSEAQVGPLKTLMPRVHVGAVPYALEAEQAKVATVAGGSLKAQFDAQAAEIAGLKGVGTTSKATATALNVQIGATNFASYLSKGGVFQVSLFGLVSCNTSATHLSVVLDGGEVGKVAVVQAGYTPTNFYFSGSVVVAPKAAAHTVSIVAYNGAKIQGCGCPLGSESVPCQVTVLEL